MQRVTGQSYLEFDIKTSGGNFIHQLSPALRLTTVFRSFSLALYRSLPRSRPRLCGCQGISQLAVTIRVPPCPAESFLFFSPRGRPGGDARQCRALITSVPRPAPPLSRSLGMQCRQSSSIHMVIRFHYKGNEIWYKSLQCHLVLPSRTAARHTCRP